MLTGIRRHPILSSLGAMGVLTAVVIAAAAVYLFGEERRSGRLVSGMLTRAVGTPVSVERAKAEGASRLILYNIHVPPGAHFAGDVRLRELRVTGGVLPLVFPRGRALSVVALSASVPLAQERTPLTPPTVESLEAVRRLVMQVIEWPAVLSLRMEGGELRSGDQVLTFALTGEKTAAGALGITMSVSPPGGPPALTLKLAGAASAGQVSLRVGVGSEPTRLGAFWPSTLPALSRLTLEADGRLRAGGDLQLAGRANADRAAGGSPLSAEFASSYRAADARLDLSRLALSWGEHLRVDGSGRVESLNDAPRLALDLAGTVEGSPLTLGLAYAGSTGAVTARIDAGAIDARRLLEMAGLGAPPTDVTVERVRSTVSGTVETAQVQLTVDATLGGLQAPAFLPGVEFEGSLRADATLRRAPSGLELAALGPSTLTLARDAAPVIVATARSRAAAGWPLAIEATFPDLRRLPSWSSLPATLTGRAVLTGDLDHARFTGGMTAELPRVEVRFASLIVATNTRAAIPISWGGPSAAKPGTFSVQRLAAYGFALDRLASSARFDEGRLLLSDIRYVQYGGRGGGWIEAAVDKRPVPLRARIEGEHIDLATLAREYGLTVAQLRGAVRYLIVLQHSTTRGLTAVGQVNSEEGGGEVGIEAIEKLLSSGQVQAESTGFLRQTLESLRVFKYASLDAEVRVTRDGGHINLSLEGKKRLGIFPAPVKAINFNNVPITLLARTFARKEQP